MRKRIHFWHRSRNVLLKRNVFYHVTRIAHVEGNTHFQEAQNSFQRNHVKCLNMCWPEGLTRQCQYQNQSYTLIGCLCLGIVFWHILRHKSKTKLPNPCSKLLNFPRSCIFHWFLKVFSWNHRPKQVCKPKGPKEEAVATSEVLPCFFCFASLPKHQETKKQETKTKTNAPPDSESWVLYVFFVFFGFSFCVFWCFVFCLFGFTSLGGFARRKQKFLKSRSRHRDTVIELGIDIGEVSIPCTVVDVYTGNTAICALPLWHVL